MNIKADGFTKSEHAVKGKKLTLTTPEVRFEVTNSCNANCIMCPREKMKREQGVLDMDLYKRILNDAVEAGCRQVSLENFGETFLDPYIFERARYAKSKGLEVYTITNGSLLDEEKCRLCVELFNKVRISMYGTTKETFEKIHRGLCFETVRDNVERLFTIRQQVSESKLEIEMYYLLMDENRHEVKEFIEKYEKRAWGLSVWKPHNWGDGRDYRERSSKKETCKRPVIGPVQVQWDGKAVPCCFDYDSSIILGDLNTQSLAEVLRGERYNALRRAHASGDFAAFPFCDCCDQLQRREDVLVYTTIKGSKVGATNTNYFELQQ